MKHLNTSIPALVAAFAVLASAASAIGQAAPEVKGPAETPLQIALWPAGQAPVDADGTEIEDANVSLLIYRPTRPNGTAMVVCAGGGYGMNLWKGAEGARTAEWLNHHGIVAAVLQYRLPRGNRHRPLSDVQRAIRTVRSKAGQWSVDPQRIGIIGYSAGGHLASMAATKFDGGNANSADPLERISCRPDFAVLVYPVITMGADTHAGSRKNLLGPDPSEELIKLFSSEQQVTRITPPTFLAHATDDKLVPPSNSKMFHDAMVLHKVRTKYLELPNGGHGLSGYKGPSWEAWKSGSLEWMREIRMLPKDGEEKK